MLVKICGLKTPAEAVAAAEAGADMIGLNFYPPSPRHIETDAAREIIDALPADVWAVGLFVDDTPQTILDRIRSIDVDAVQIHGEFSDDEADALLGLTIIRALSISKEDDLRQLDKVRADYVLLDAAVKGMRGGTGKSFDWGLAAKARDHTDARIMLAGGLRPDNVSEAILQARPDGVDVASGVETAPGVKSIELIRRFIQAVRKSEDAG